MVEDRGKRLATVKSYGIADAIEKSAHSCEASYKRKRGKVKIAKDARA